MVALLGVSLLSACADDAGDMTKQEAIAECQRFVKEDVTDMRFESAVASKDDRYWEVTGTTDRGNYRCVVNALDHKAFSGVWDK